MKNIEIYPSVHPFVNVLFNYLAAHVQVLPVWESYPITTDKREYFRDAKANGFTVAFMDFHVAVNAQRSILGELKQRQLDERAMQIGEILTTAASEWYAVYGNTITPVEVEPSALLKQRMVLEIENRFCSELQIEVPDFWLP